jgi:hypothetical protein
MYGSVDGRAVAHVVEGALHAGLAVSPTYRLTDARSIQRGRRRTCGRFRGSRTLARLHVVRLGMRSCTPCTASSKRCSKVTSSATTRGYDARLVQHGAADSDAGRQRAVDGSGSRPMPSTCCIRWADDVAGRDQFGQHHGEVCSVSVSPRRTGGACDLHHQDAGTRPAQDRRRRE